jgi:hypothetical protein
MLRQKEEGPAGVTSDKMQILPSFLLRIRKRGKASKDPIQTARKSMANDKTRDLVLLSLCVVDG